jgi:hypothetical protein
MWTLFQTIFFKKFLVLTNLIYGQTNDGNVEKFDFDEGLEEIESAYSLKA